MTNLDTGRVNVDLLHSIGAVKLCLVFQEQRHLSGHVTSALEAAIMSAKADRNFTGRTPTKHR